MSLSRSHADDKDPPENGIALKDVSNDHDATPSGPATIPLTPKEKLRLGVSFVSICVANFAVGFDTKCVAIIIRTLVLEFDSVDDLGWYATAYLAALCSISLTYGKLYSMLPMRRVFVASLAIFLVGSILCAVARSSNVFIAGRAIAGLGGAGIMNGANIIISHIAPMQYRPVLLGLSGGAECTAIAVGPLLAGAITTYTTWRVCFYINIPICITAIIVTATCLRDSELAMEPNESHRFSGVSEFFHKIDISGVLILVPMVVSLLLALQWGGTTYSWNSGPVIATLAVSAILLPIFGFQQRRKGSHATVPLEMLKHRSVTLGALMTFCNSAALYIVGYYLLLWYQTVLSFSVFRSGVLDLGYDVAFVVAILSAGFITTWIGYYTPTMVIGSILMSIGAGLCTTLTHSTGLLLVEVYQVIFGLGNGLAFQQPYIAIQTVLEKNSIPSALTLLSFAQSLGGTISLAAAQAVYLAMLPIGNSDGIGGVDGANGAIKATFYLATAISVLTMIPALGVRWNSVKDKSD